jgi:hypothetical protein
VPEEEEDEDQGFQNKDLNDVLDFYDCHDLLPYASHIMWLSSVKSALGYIPFSLDYFAIRCLVILKEEENKKTVKESRDLQQSTERASSGMSIGLDKAIINR